MFNNIIKDFYKGLSKVLWDIPLEIAKGFFGRIPTDFLKRISAKKSLQQFQKEFFKKFSKEFVRKKNGKKFIYQELLKKNLDEISGKNIGIF